MAIKSAPYYWIECDKCGRRCPPEDYEITAWSDKEGAIACALGAEWSLSDERDLCPDCAAEEDAEEEARGESS